MRRVPHRRWDARLQSAELPGTQIGATHARVAAHPHRPRPRSRGRVVEPAAPEPRPSRGRFWAILVTGLTLAAACETTPLPSGSPVSQPPASVGTVPSPSPSTPSAAPAAFHWQRPEGPFHRQGARVDLAGRGAGRRRRGNGDVLGRLAGVVGTTSLRGRDREGRDMDLRRRPRRARGARGRLRVGFDVDRGAGPVETSPDGRLTLDYRPPVSSWGAARTILPKACALPALAVDSGRYHVASTCGDAIRYAEGTANGAWSATRFRPPAGRIESGPQLAVDGDTLYLAYTRFVPTEADTCGGPYRGWCTPRACTTGRALSPTASGRNLAGSAELMRSSTRFESWTAASARWSLRRTASSRSSSRSTTDRWSVSDSGP